MKWEYKLLHIPTTKWTSTGLPAGTGENFDELGDDGWELVRVEPILRGGSFTRGAHTVALVAFFKRGKK